MLQQHVSQHKRPPLVPATRARPQCIAARRQRELMVVIAEQENAQSIDWLDESEVEFEGLLPSEDAEGSDVLPKIPLSKLIHLIHQIGSNSQNFFDVFNCYNSCQIKPNVFYDLQLAVDIGDAVVLTLLDKSAAFDNIDQHAVSDHFYNDDEQIYTAFSRISYCVGETKRWVADTKIKFNDSQTAELVVCKKASLRKLEDLSLVIRDASISPSTSVRHLGFNIDRHLTMQQKINTTSRNAFYQPRRIVKIRKFLSCSSCIQLVSAFLLSQIDYGNSLLAGLKAAQL
ncbi:hypothetical protein DAPPUDRAFT_250268 [Daphnia pulex]|uniref:Reverse transcriptase domain-containing protein n=1 Tax=Daphnia pulex TaxID=6669 RepID=E9GY79_DAPPU|nr:hypothetical protein DAPPUDRAFT_250268 [Daphnia pulex]|eukprot:EFX75611.1 hypothetical protein DAPPUDRAFT_250268 [Daphnia pulex]